MAISKSNNAGIPIVDPLSFSYSYVTPHKGKQFAGQDILRHSQYGKNFINERIQDSIFDPNPFHKKLNPITGTKQGVGQRGLGNIENYFANTSDAESFVFFDIETLGTSHYSLQGSKSDFELFDVPQISFRRYNRTGGKLVDTGEALNLALGISNNTRVKAERMLKELTDNPLAWNTYNDEKRRTMIDLMLYSNEANFKKETIGNRTISIITGQETARPSINANAFEINQHLHKMKQGLNNLTNDNLVSNKSDALFAMDSFVKKGDIFSGYNIFKFDRPAMKEYFQDTKEYAGSKFFQHFNNTPQMDLYPIAKAVTAQDKNYVSSNITQESVYKHYVGNTVQEHLASTDLMMTAEIANAFGFGDNSLSSNAIGMVETFKVKPGTSYIVNRGIQANPNEYNQGANQFDYKFIQNPKTGEYEITSGSYQPNPAIRGSEINFLGQAAGPTINGVDYTGYVLKDVNTEEISVMFSDDPFYMQNKFRDGHFIRKSEMSKRDQQYFEADNARRAYDRLTSGDVAYGTHDPISDLQSTYNYIDRYKEMVAQNPQLTKQEAINAIIKEETTKYNKLKNLNPDSYVPGVKTGKIRNSILLSDIMTDQRDIWQGVIDKSNELFPVKNPDDFSQYLSRGTMIRSARQQLDANVQLVDDVIIGRIHDRSLPINFTALGNESMINLTTIDDFRSSMHYLFDNKNLTPQQQQNRLQVLTQTMNNIANENSPKNIKRHALTSTVQANIQADLIKYGKVQRSTIDTIADSTYDFLNSSQHVIKGVKGEAFHALYRPTQANLRKIKMTHQMNTEFANQVIERAAIDATSNSRNVRLHEDIYVSEALASRLNINRSALERMQMYYQDTQMNYGFNQDTLAKARQNLKFQNINENESIARIISQYEQYGFNVGLVTNDTRNTVEMLFTPKESGVQIGNLSYVEALSNNSVGHQTLPLYNNNYSLDTNVGAITSGFNMQVSASGQVTMVNKQVAAFQEIEKEARNMRQTINKRVQRGEPLDLEDIVSHASGRIEGRISAGSSYAAYGATINQSEVSPDSSALKNLIAGGSVNTEPVLLDSLRTNRPEVYENWQEYRKNYRDANIFTANSFWSRQKIGLQDAELESMLYFAENTGVSLRTAGVSATARRKGQATIANPQDRAVFGFLDSNRRETIVKSVNIEPIDLENATQIMNQRYQDVYAHIGDESTRNQRINQAINRHIGNSRVMGREILEDGGEANKKASIVIANTMQTNDIVISDAIQKRTREIELEINTLTAQRIMDISKEEKARIDKSIRDLHLESSTIATYSVHEGRSLISPNFANTLQTTTTKEITLGENELIPEQIMQRLNPNYIPGQELGIKPGDVIGLKEPIRYNDMIDMGLIDDKGLLTIGTVGRYEDSLSGTIASDSEFSTRRSTSRRIHSSGKIDSITMNSDGRIVFHLGETVDFRDGDKIMTADGQLRTAATIINPEYMANMGFDINTDLYMEHGKASRENMGSILSTWFDTTQMNIADDLAKIDFANINNLDDLELLPGVRQGLQSMLDEGIALQDIDINQAYQRIFEPQANLLGLTAGGENPSMFFNPETGIFEILPNLNRGTLTGQSGLENTQAFLTSAINNFGFTEDSLSIGIVKHNTGNYSGQLSRPRITMRENMLNEMIGSYALGDDYQNSLFNEAMQNMRAAEDHSTYINYGQDALKVLGMKQEDIAQAIQQEGNVIFDYSGNFRADTNQNFYRNEQGVLVVDGLSLPVAKDNDIFGTMKDSSTIRLYNNEDGFGVQSLADYLSEGDRQAFIQTQRAGEKFYKQDYVPIIPSMANTGDILDSSFARPTDLDINALTNSLIELGKVTDENEMRRALRQGNDAITNYTDDIAKFLSNSQQGSFIKGGQSYQTRYGGSYRSARMSEYYNATSAVQDQLTDNNILLSRTTARENLRGTANEILIANNVSLEEVQATGKSKMDYILDRLSDAEDTSFKVYGVANRYPNQSTENIAFASIRVQDGAADNMTYISPRLAKALNSDYDGDQIYLYHDFYKGFSNPETKAEKLINLQSELNRFSDYTNQVLSSKQVGFYGENDNMTFSMADYILDAVHEDGTVASLFSDKSTALHIIEEHTASAIVGSTIGRTDNIRMRNMTMYREFINAQIDAGILTRGPDGTGTAALREAESTLEEILQGAISAKKTTAENIGIADGMTVSQMIDNSSEYVQQYQEFLNTLSRPSNTPGRGVNEFLNAGNRLKILESSDAAQEAARKTYEGLAEAQAVYSALDYDMSTVSLGLSSGLDEKNAFINQMRDGNFNNILLTQATEDIVRDLAPDMLEQHNQAKAKQAQEIAANILARTNRTSSQAVESLTDAASQQMDRLQDIAQKTSVYNKIRANSETGGILGGLGRTISSPMFQLGAGLAGAWMIGSAIKRAPTPEGNEAQQEAQPYEVAPAALLTSPTARVTPISESIQMNISGRGNIDNEELIGAVRQQIEAQTQMQMNMHLTQQDNTQKLDNSFYESQINRALGFN